jgi:hypothetical protein
MTGAPRHRFFILVPSHNEEKLMPSLLDNLRQLDYPSTLILLANVQQDSRRLMEAHEGGRAGLRERLFHQPAGLFIPVAGGRPNPALQPNLLHSASQIG